MNAPPGVVVDVCLTRAKTRQNALITLVEQLRLHDTETALDVREFFFFGRSVQGNDVSAVEQEGHFQFRRQLRIDDARHEARGLLHRLWLAVLLTVVLSAFAPRSSMIIPPCVLSRSLSFSFPHCSASLYVLFCLKKVFSFSPCPASAVPRSEICVARRVAPHQFDSSRRENA
jgi:hypothetical protein